ncbi:SDR family oxidoreductase [Priestia flexa]|uniref:SDR family oxidoreductase n=1 Tax=Priestia flexa TaxID=86664 RepID=UPI00204186E6|nr:SDR family oxidoreductase [Priestia flexa]MCM3068382.1 SDR family oxidoreductase [Priestia flexa]
MKVLVTGGAGFIGSNIVDRLIEQSFEVVIIDNLSTGREENLNPKAKFYKMDIISDEVKEVFATEKPDYVIHHGAQIDVQKSLTNPLFDAQVNILGTINILENCKLYGVRKIVYASSAAVYGDPDYLGVDEKHQVNPLSFYGISKHTPEHYLKAYSHLYGLKYTILRYANVYGIRQDPKGEGGVVSIFVDKLLSNELPIIFGDGEQTRDFIYVSDIADANILALSKGDNDILNISCNQQTSINDLLSLMNNLANKNLHPVYKEERSGDIKHSYLDNSKAIEILNWKPKYTLSTGLKETLNYYRKLFNEQDVKVQVGSHS